MKMQSPIRGVIDVVSLYLYLFLVRKDVKMGQTDILYLLL